MTMETPKIKTSPEYKKSSLLTMYSIFMFTALYIALFVLGVLFSFLCIALGLSMMSMGLDIFGWIVGLILITIATLILAFLMKFFFKKNKIDRSDMTEITRHDEPKFFQLLDEVVSEIKTTSPKKVYLSPDVNASVFYDSGFWNLFIPVKKNLQIGAGLINTSTVDEFKAVLSHELAHFSQRTMKIGAYVYSVNHVIYNLVYENGAYEKFTKKLAKIAFFFSIIVKVVSRNIQLFERIFVAFYRAININYLGLSREMEFHADALAATVTGSEPLITSLLRINMAEQSYNEVLDFYQEKTPEPVKTLNIYPQQLYVLNSMAQHNNLPIEDGLPKITMENTQDKSKLFFEDKSSSHPNDKERIAKLLDLNIQKNSTGNRLAWSLFSHPTQLQESITQQVFSGASFEKPPLDKSYDEFIEEYRKTSEETSLPPVYNGYYDFKDPAVFAWQDNLQLSRVRDLKDLFGAPALNTLNEAAGLKQDLNTLKKIISREIEVSSFNYDQTKYSLKNCSVLLERLEKDIIKVNQKILKNDMDIYVYFLSAEAATKRPGKLKELYAGFFDFKKNYDYKISVFSEMENKSYFMNQRTPVKTIHENLVLLYEFEKEFKREIEDIINSEIYGPVLTEDLSDLFKDYLSENRAYFNKRKYDYEAYSVLNDALEAFYIVMNATLFDFKKELLEYQAGLLK